MVDSGDSEQLVDAGLALLQAGDFAQAATRFRAALAKSPDHPDALNLLGVSLHQLGDLAAARDSLQRAVLADPCAADAHYNLGEILRAIGERQASEAAFERCVALDPATPLAWRRLAKLRVDRNDLSAAAIAAESAADLEPADVDLNAWAGRLWARANQPEKSIRLLHRASEHRPDDVDLLSQLFDAALAARDFDTAAPAIDRAIALDPKNHKLLVARVHCLLRAGRLNQAVDAAKEHIRIEPDDPEAHYNLGLAFEKQRELGAAAVAFGSALERNPDHALSYVKLTETLLGVGHFRDAETTIRQAVELDPKLVAARVYLSITIDRIPGRTQEAIDEAAGAVDLDADNCFALSWYAALLARHGRHGDAAEQFQRLLELQPDHQPGLSGYGSLLASQGQIERGWEYLARASELAPQDPQPVASSLFFANGHPHLSPGQLFALHLEWASRVSKLVPKVFIHWDNVPDPNRRVRVAYLSPDLRGHSVASFLGPLMATHDKTQVEITILDNAPRSDHMSVRLHQFADRWVRIVGGGSDRVCDIVRELEIDILVDLAGQTGDNRLDVFAQRPAPVQVSYLGYPNTTGLEVMDYRLTDAIADPPGEADAVHTEKLIRLEGGFLCFAPTGPTPEIGPLPAEQGEFAPNITFAAFNAVHKINRTVIALWTRVLDAVPGSRLLLKAVGLSDSQTRQLITDAFAEHGVHEDRLILVERTPGVFEHLQVYNRCDIALDSSPYNGTTTTCEALWMGVPVIALAGDRHAARVSLSILTHIGRPELAAPTADEFVRIAAELAGDRARLARLRATLREQMRTSRLMDAKAHAAAIEHAYRDMWRTWCATQPATNTPLAAAKKLG